MLAVMECGIICFTMVSSSFRAYRTNHLGTTSEFIITISILILTEWLDDFIWHGLGLVSLFNL